MKKKMIFVLEDEKNIQHLIKYNLESSGYEVICFSTGFEFLKFLKENTCDLILLDIMLPDTDGFDILSKLKRNGKNSQIPVIMLTAKKEELDKILGLEMGADDYITKPFSVRELTSRIKAVLRRSMQNLPDDNQVSGNEIRNLDIVMYKDKHQVFKSGSLIDLSLKEYQLLETLMSDPGKVFTRDVLLNKIWGYDYYGETRTIDVHIRYIRRKLGDNGPEFKYIDTVRGIGYKFIVQ